MFEIIGLITRLLGHLGGAWSCTCKLAVIVDTAAHVNSADALDAGFEFVGKD